MRQSALLGGLLSALTTAAGAQAPPPSGFPGEAPDGPPAQILSFTAEPRSIGGGGTATLRWAAVNAYSLHIDPEVGTVATRGRATVSPRAATTYTLTVTGSGGTTTQTVSIDVDGEVTGLPTTPEPEPTRMPTLADGKPDLSGIYLGGRGVRLQGPVELLQGAEGFRVPADDQDLGQGALCLPPGVPAATSMPYPLQIVHKPDVIVILYEAYHLFRIIPIGVDHPEDLDPTWMGHSVAHWDGDTLVVDVVAFNDRTRVAGHRHTTALHVIERYRRTDYDTIEYEATAADPNVFAAAVRIEGNLTLHPEWEIGEYVCAENNKDYSELFE